MFLFQCGIDNLYALSTDAMGRNIPLTRCPAGWRLCGDLAGSEHEADFIAPVRKARRFGYCYLVVTD